MAVQISNKFIGTFALTFFLIVLLVRLDRRSSVQIVPTPSFTSNNHHQGPWPDCYFKQMTAIECEKYIHVFAPDVHTEVFYPGEKDDVAKSPPGIDVERVRIFVNETGYVEQTPGRG